MEIRIDVRAIYAALNFDAFAEHLRNSTRHIVREAYDFWQSEAGRRLNSSREAYLAALRIDGNTIILEHDMSVLAEVGATAYSLNIPAGKVVPLNINRDPFFHKAEHFRTSDGTWTHPGFPGVWISADVETELLDNILPKYVDRAIKAML